MIHVNLPLTSRTQLESEYREHSDSYERALYELHRRLKVQLEQRGLRTTIKYRVKSFTSYYEKIQRRCVDETSDRLLISDVLGIRIVCPFIDDLEAVEDVLTRNFTVQEREKKGAEFSFKEFGYDSLHYLIALPGDLAESFHINSDLLAEVQLRTILQDAWAEVEHEMVYKSQITPFDVNLRRKLAALNANLSLSDMIFHEIRVYQRELQHQLDRRRVAFMKMVSKSDLDPMSEDAAPPPLEVKPTAPDHPLVNSIGADSQESQLLKALYDHNAHHYDAAIETYTQILGGNAPERIRSMVHLHRGMAHFAVGQYESAESDFRESLKINFDSERAHLYLGLCLRQLSCDSEALEQFESCLAINPASEDGLLSRAQLYYSMGNISDAIGDCDALLHNNSEHQQANKFRDFLNSQIGV